MGEDPHLMPIEDPIDTSHDLGRILTYRSLGILRDELETAAARLEDGCPLEQILAEHTT